MTKESYSYKDNLCCFHQNHEMPNVIKNNRRRVQIKRRKRRRKLIKLLCIHLIFSFILSILWTYLLVKTKSFENLLLIETTMRTNSVNENMLIDFQNRVSRFADENNLKLTDWPNDLIEYGREHPELEEFVLRYPIEHNKKHKIDLNELKNPGTVPLLLQWDQRWGYEDYAGELFGLSGCGPTCLSMVAIYLYNDVSFNPDYMREFSKMNQYEVDGNGSSWNLISEGGRRLGFDVTEIPLSKERINNNLLAGNPIICNVGPGDFTSTGHFIVFSAVVDDKIKVNDPNSIENSEKLWTYEELEKQIRNLWVFRNLNSMYS